MCCDLLNLKPVKKKNPRDFSYDPEARKQSIASLVGPNHNVLSDSE